MEPKGRKRIYWSDIEAICSPYCAQLVQHPITRTISILLNTGQWGWMINPHTGKVITQLNEINLEEWRLLIGKSLDEMQAQK